MKNRKKLLVLLMAALTALALTACNNNTPAPTPDNPGQEENQNPEQNQVTVDYTGDVTGWMYAPDTDDEITPWLIAIDSAEYGTAGASLKQVNAAVSLMRLAMDESGNAEAQLKTYLSGMNDTQRDYFSFQWQQAMKGAAALRQGTPDTALLAESGNEGFDLTAVEEARLTALNDTVTTLLRGHNVADEWKNHTDLEPFSTVGIG